MEETQTSWSTDAGDRVDGEIYLLYSVVTDVAGEVKEQLITAEWSETLKTWKMDENGRFAPDFLKHLPLEWIDVKVLSWLRIPPIPNAAFLLAEAFVNDANRDQTQNERNDDPDDRVEDGLLDEIEYRDLRNWLDYDPN